MENRSKLIIFAVIFIIIINILILAFFIPWNNASSKTIGLNNNDSSLNQDKSNFIENNADIQNDEVEKLNPYENCVQIKDRFDMAECFDEAISETSESLDNCYELNDDESQLICIGGVAKATKDYSACLLIPDFGDSRALIDVSNQCIFEIALFKKEESVCNYLQEEFPVEVCKAIISKDSDECGKLEKNKDACYELLAYYTHDENVCKLMINEPFYEPMCLAVVNKDSSLCFEPPEYIGISNPKKLCIALAERDKEMCAEVNPDESCWDRLYILELN